ncbi:MAG TPA: transglutaminase-like domain-containing protein, partial [Pirellula sp.]|nr:transglutaminase-like domain-containing protein [Pirellula sp.]
KVDVTSTQGLFRHNAKSRMRVSLKGIPLEQRIEITTLERDTGELIGIEGFLEIGSKKQSFKGTVVQKELRLTGEEEGQPFSVSVEWKKEYRGPFAVDQSMHRSPLQSRETRLLKYFDPILRKVIDGRLEASDYIKTPTMLGGTRELLEVRNIAMIGDSSSQALLWVDKQGEGFKSFVQANDILSFRTDPIVAQVVDSLADLRAMDSVSIPIGGTDDMVDQLTNAPRDLASISFRVSHRSEDPYSLFTDRIGQRIRSLDARSTQVTVFRNGVESDLLLESDSASKKDDGTLAASEFIPTKSAQVKKIANGLISAAKANTADRLSNTDIANVFRREIQKRISLKEFDKQLGTVPNSLIARQANCVEHALLLASICRAAQIPTRIALGVKFNRSKEMPAMNFHAWVEIRDGARWVPLDSTIEEFPMPLDRIKIRDSKFNGANPYIDIISVYRLLPELEIKVMPQ